MEMLCPRCRIMYKEDHSCSGGQTAKIDLKWFDCSFSWQDIKSCIIRRCKAPSINQKSYKRQPQTFYYHHMNSTRLRVMLRSSGLIPYLIAVLQKQLQLSEFSHQHLYSAMSWPISRSGSIWGDPSRTSEANCDGQQFWRITCFAGQTLGSRPRMPQKDT